MSNLERLFILVAFCLTLTPGLAQEDDGQDIVILPEQPQGQQVGLAPASDHWVYKLPNQEQTKIVTLTATILDHLGQPVPSANVLACCEPWSFTTSADTDASGRISLRGPIGDWSIYAGGTTKTSGVLASVRNIKVQEDKAVRVVAGKEIEWRPVTRDGRPFRLDRRTDLKFMPADIIDAEEVVGGGETVNAEQIQGLRGVKATLPCGRLIKGVIRLSATPILSGVLSLAQDPDDNQPGLLLWKSVTTQSSSNLVIDTQRMGRLVVSFDGYGTSKARVVLNVERRGAEGGEASAVIWVPSNGAKYTFFVSPGEYAVRAAVHVGVSAAQYVPHRVKIAPGQEQTLVYGGKFQARINTRKWPRKSLDIWFDILDNKGNYLLHVEGETRIKLDYDGKTIFDDRFIKCQGRWFRLDYDFGPKAKERNLDFRYSKSSGILGNVVLSGQVPQDADESLRADLPVVYSSEHFVFRFRENWPDVAKRGADNMEIALKWLADNYGGPIQMRGGGRLLEIRAWTPVGVGASGGDAVRISIYSAYDFDGVGRLLFHELGHAYIGHPPHHQAAGMNVGEPLATLIADYCIRAVAGERAFQGARYRASNDFFQWLMAKDETVGQAERSNYMFIFHYIHNRYGQAANRRFFQAMCADEGNLAQLLASADFLATEPERMAAAYSCLTGGNLAWLFRWAGFSVSDEKVEQALTFFKNRQVRLPE